MIHLPLCVCVLTSSPHTSLFSPHAYHPSTTCPQERQKRSIKLTNELQRLSPLLDEAQAQENQWKGTNKRLAQKAKVRIALPPRAAAFVASVHQVSFVASLVGVCGFRSIALY